jgi:ABC-type dipeptide/oligopeptide/nickel transport system permease subunit
VSVFGLDIRVWIGLVASIGGLVVGIRGYLRSRRQDLLLAVVNLMLGIAWSIIALLAAFSLVREMEGLILPLSSLVVLIGISGFAIIFWAARNNKDGR